MLDLVGANLWFIDGNHEDFSLLAELASRAVAGARVAVRPNIFHLPRGHRWQWHGRTWLACGGGVSLDKAARAEGSDWWPQEEITAQEAAMIAGGPADVMVCHDCPSGVAHAFPGSRPGGRRRTWRATRRTGNGWPASWLRCGGRRSST